MEAEVARAFRQRPRSVEKAPGFLWLEVMTDRSDPAVFYLLTRWTDQSSFESWHKSAEHRESHAFIPKGLKLDASWTHLYSLDRIDGVTGSPLTDTIADATLLISSYASQSNAVYLFSLERDGRVRAASHAASGCGPSFLDASADRPARCTGKAQFRAVAGSAIYARVLARCARRPCDAPGPPDVPARATVAGRVDGDQSGTGCVVANAIPRSSR
jgi:quinol monooxygenase YgiN